MKKVFYFILGLTILSCNKQDADRAAYLAEIDASAAMAAYEAALTAGYAYAFPVYAAVGAAAIGGAASAFAAEHNVGTDPSTGRGFELPTEYLVDGNPFECIGYTHNRIVHHIRVNNITKHQVYSLDSGFYKQSTRLYNICDPETGADPDEAYEFFLSEDFHSTIDTVDINAFATEGFYDVLSQKSLSDTTGIYSYIDNFIKEVSGSLPSNATYIDKIDFINNEIDAQLGTVLYQPTKDKGLIFLTVYKHSTYYWR